MVDDENSPYAIKTDRIVLKKLDTVLYELTGTTDKYISISGQKNDVKQAFYIRANNVTLNGGIKVANIPVKMVLDVPEGTINTIEEIKVNDLTVKGSGTLKTKRLSITQKTSTHNMPSALHIQDTTIIVNSLRSNEWNGECVLSGTANVTCIGNGEDVPLKVGQKSGDKHSLTLKDSAKLYCLQDSDSPSPYSVSGLEIFNNAPLVLQDNSYLEAKGKPSSGKYVGNGIYTDGSIEVKDSAEIKAAAQGTAISAVGDVTISGGKVTANSTGNKGIYSRGNVNIQNSVVKTQTPDGKDGILSKKTKLISGSWIETTGKESYDGDIQNSVLFNGDAGKVIGGAWLPADAEIAKGRTLLIPKGAFLRVGSGKTLVNNGLVTVEGDFANAGGTLICNSHFGGTADCQTPAVCSLCGVSYGAKNPDNHVKLTHVDAKAATAESAGNIEYWHCEKCGKYFSDAKAAHEITLEQTVIEKLPGKEAIKDLPKTGDDSHVALWLLLLAVSGGVLLKNLADRRENAD